MDGPRLLHSARVRGTHKHHWSGVLMAHSVDAFAQMEVSSGSLESVCCMTMDPAHKMFAIGDTAGHIRVWDVRKLDMANLTDNAEDCFEEIAFWRAHGECVTSLGIVFQEDGQGYIVAGSIDCTTTMWSTRGQRVGVFGKNNRWNLDDPSTWMKMDGEVSAVDMDTQYFKARPAAACSPLPE